MGWFAPKYKIGDEVLFSHPEQDSWAVVKIIDTYISRVRGDIFPHRIYEGIGVPAIRDSTTSKLNIMGRERVMCGLLEKDLSTISPGNLKYLVPSYERDA